MKVDAVLDWFGNPVKLDKFTGPGPFDVTGDDLLDLYNMGRDVMVTHVKQEQPTRRQLLAGAQPVPELTIVYLDVRGGRFHQR